MGEVANNSAIIFHWPNFGLGAKPWRAGRDVDVGLGLDLGSNILLLSGSLFAVERRSYRHHHQTINLKQGPVFQAALLAD